MLDSNAYAPATSDGTPLRSPLPGLLELEELARRAERRYIDVVCSIFFRDLPETAPHLTGRWEALLNGRIRTARELRALVAQARIFGSRWPESLTRAMARARERLLAIDREERHLVAIGLYQDHGGE